VETARIGIHRRSATVFDVGAPMQHKDLCYAMLFDAAVVAAATEPQHFRAGLTQWAITMDMTGRVDISAPVPVDYPMWLADARDVIERYNDDSAPVFKAFSDKVMGNGSPRLPGS
jgi:hypothetical protein